LASLRLEQIEKRYPKVDEPAVRQVDLTIADGEFFVLLGPSGCGKSTLLKLIAGLEEPTAGQIYIDGAPVNYTPPGRRNIAMVFQDYALYPHMTVRQNINFPLKMRRVERAAAREAVSAAAGSVELGELLERPIGALSGGQRQRVALARAIVRNPAAMLLDEPLSNLDAILRVQTRDELLRLHRSIKATIVYVTHDQVEAMTMGHRIAVMNRGVIEQLGSPRAVFDYPRNLFVASFIGTPQMNLIKGDIAREHNGYVFRNSSVEVTLDDRYVSCFEGNGRLERFTLGVRPNAVMVEPVSTSKMSWQVELIEEFGNERLVSVRCRDKRIRTLVPNRTRIAEGDAVGISIDSDDVHIFDAAGVNVIASLAEQGGHAVDGRAQADEDPAVTDKR